MCLKTFHANKKLAPTVIGITILTLLFCSCVKQISHEELCRIEESGRGNTFLTLIWYMGSKDGYDYFHAGFSQDTNSLSWGHQGAYKVLSKNTSVDMRFKLTTDKSLWTAYSCSEFPDGSVGYERIHDIENIPAFHWHRWPEKE
ncbi:MAG TPA: hypothetical protein PKB02_14870 [Anaerohalosphaeraceae bacterium]|nr:hypothetical protein [Anaerohalosphaeraceae bacterium]